MKILYISHTSELGGAENSLLMLLKHLDKKNFTPLVVLPYEGPLKRSLETLGIRTFVLHIEWWIHARRFGAMVTGEGLLKRSERIADLIKKEKIDIVHTNSAVVAEGAVAAKITGIPHVWQLHEILKEHPGLLSPLPLYLTNRFFDLSSDVIVVVSEALKKSISEEISYGKIRVIHNCQEMPEEVEQNRSFRETINVTNKETLVCNIGLLVKEKGKDIFIEMAAEVLKKRKDVRFLSIGAKRNRPLMRSLRSTIKNASIKKYIAFLGYRNDIWRILKEIDIYVVSSRTESFSLTAIEAMAAGKPVIATRCGGPEEIVVDGETGLLIPKDNPRAMADAVLSLMKNPQTMKKMGMCGKKHYEKYFAPGKNHKAFEKIYSSLEGRKQLKAQDKKMLNALIELLSTKSLEQNLLSVLLRNPFTRKMSVTIKKIFDLFRAPFT